MTNLEYINKNYCNDASFRICKPAYEIKNRTSCDFRCNQCEFCYPDSKKLKKFLKEEYDESNKVKLTQFEYDLIKVARVYYRYDYFVLSYFPYRHLKDLGYFKNVTSQMTFGYVLHNVDIERSIT